MRGVYLIALVGFCPALIRQVMLCGIYIHQRKWSSWYQFFVESIETRWIFSDTTKKRIVGILLAVWGGGESVAGREDQFSSDNSSDIIQEVFREFNEQWDFFLHLLLHLEKQSFLLAEPCRVRWSFLRRLVSSSSAWIFVSEVTM